VNASTAASVVGKAGAICAQLAGLLARLQFFGCEGRPAACLVVGGKNAGHSAANFKECLLASWFTVFRSGGGHTVQYLALVARRLRKDLVVLVVGFNAGDATVRITAEDIEKTFDFQTEDVLGPL
jgi:hypothetical protein